MARVRVIGITGGSGAGKGAVCALLGEMGAYVLDCDKIAHAVMLKKGAAYDEVVCAFDCAMRADGEIDRRALGAVVFADGKKRKRLEDIIHPHVAAFCADVIAKSESGFITIDAPLLVEANMHGFCDYVWLVIADLDIRIERIIRRDGISAEAANIRLAAQTPAEELMPYADAVIENNGGYKDLRIIIEGLFTNIQ